MNSSTKSIIQAVLNFDLQDALRNSVVWNTQRERNLFGAVLLLNLIAFGMFIIHHMLHNHTPRFPWIGPQDQFFAGRWFNVVLLKLNYLADLPILGPLMAIAFSAIAGLLLLRIWRLNLSGLESFIVLGMLTTFPMCLAYFYYTYQTPLFGIAILFAVWSVYVLQKATVLRFAAGALIAMLGLASYQPSLSIMTTVIASAFIADLIREKDTEIRPAIVIAGLRTAAVAVGTLCYRMSLSILEINQSHATRTVELHQLPERVVLVVRNSFRHLTITQPDLLAFLKTVLLCVLLAALIAAVFRSRRKLLVAALIVISFPLLIIATKSMFLLSSDTGFFNYRYNMAMAFLHAFSFAALVHCIDRQILRSAAFAVGAFLVLRFVQADLVRQEVLYRGQQHDMALANRILTRMESLPDLDVSKTYDFVRVGKYSQFRQDALSRGGREAETYGDSHMDNGEITDRWTDEEVFVLLGSKINFKFRGTDPNFIEKVNSARATTLKDRMPWPHASSVFIEDETIYVYVN